VIGGHHRNNVGKWKQYSLALLIGAVVVCCWWLYGPSIWDKQAQRIEDKEIPGEVTRGRGRDQCVFQTKRLAVYFWTLTSLTYKELQQVP